MNKVALLFFENQKQSWNRFPKIISKSIFFGDKYFIFNSGAGNIDDGLFEGVFEFKGRCKEIIPVINKYDKIIVVLMSFRIIDIMFYNYILKTHDNVKGVSIQHGIYSDKLVRVNLFKFFNATWKRIFSYIISIFYYPFLTFFQKITLILQVKQVYYKNKFPLKKSSVIKLINLPENVFIFEKKWEKYYMDNYYLVKPNFTIIPPIDDELKNNPQILPKSSVVIIIQSMVEDGRYSRTEYLRELNIILQSISNDKHIYFKMHPRSDMSLYQNLSKKVIFKKDFVLASHVVSSYSSLMKTYSEMGSLVFKWNFNNHHVPSVFANYSHSEGREKKLKSFLKISNDLKVTKNNISISKIYSEKFLKI